MLTIVGFTVFSQTADLPVSASPTTICVGAGSTITTTGSEIGVQYSLRNSLNVVVAGPTNGTGSDLSFPTGTMSSTETFNIYAEPIPINQFSIGVNAINYGISLTNHNRGIGSSGLGVGMWIRTSSTAGGFQYLASKYTGVVGFLFYMDANGKINMDGRKYNAAYVASGPSTIAVNDGQWHYVVGTTNGASFKVYIDGVLQASNTSGSAGHMSLTNTANLMIGLNNSGAFPFDGELDDVCIWNSDISAATIASNYTTCLVGNEPSLTALFKFDGGLGTIIDDAVLSVNGSLNNNGAFITQGATPCELGSPLQMTQTATVNVVNIVDETLSGASTFCNGGSATITTGSSTSGANYFLIDDNGMVTDGPVSGTGSSINLNTGTITSTTTYKVFASLSSATPANGALDLDGTNEYLNLTTNSRNISNELSVACWVKLSPSASNRFIVSKYDVASGFYMFLNTSGKVSFDGKGLGGSGSQSGSSTTSIDDNQWHYLVGTGKLGGNFKIYVDGVLEGTSSANATGSTMGNSATFSAGSYSTTYADIIIDDVALWNSELTLSTIQANMNACLDGTETSLQGLYKMNENAGSTIEDLSANVITGTLTNMDPATDWVTGSTAGCFSSTGCGFFLSQDVTLTIDNAAPVADVASLPNVNEQCQVSSLTAPSATDFCSGAITGTHNATFPITSNTTVTWTYDDGDGNTSTQTQDIVLNDNTVPVATISSLPNVSGQCSVTSLSAPTATDNCAGSLNGTHNATFPILSTTSITWTYDDGNGNTSTQTQNIVINDITAPVANAGTLSDLTAQCSITTLTAPTATDNCAGSVTGTHNATLPISASTSITWTYDDGKGNTSTQVQNVIINDNIAPIANIASLADLNAQCSVSSLTAPTSTDNCSGSILGTTGISLPITSNTTITWTYDDGHGNTSTQTQNIVLLDNVAPVADVTNLSDVTAQCSITSLTAPTATDNCMGNITGTHNATFPITSNMAVIWTYDDGDGNTSTQIQNMVLNDNIDPVADLASLPDVSGQCSITSLTSPSATDNCSGALIGTHNVSFPVNSTTVVTWTFDDGNGNTSTQMQNIVINDNTAPVADIPSLSDVISQCSVTSLSAPAATDNCLGAIVGTHNATLPINTTTAVTWTYVDGNGNTTTQMQNVVVNDNTAPVADQATLADVTSECSISSLSNPSATDNCSAVLITNDAVLPITANATVTWTYTDVSGNFSTQTQGIVINDVTAPVADVATLSDITNQCIVTAYIPPSATDNCAGAILGTPDATFPISITTLVTWTYDDGQGNTSTQTQNFIIDDNIAPVEDVATLSDLTATCEITSLTAPTSTDNCAGSIVGTHSAFLPLTVSTIVTWTYDDGNGNQSMQFQNVIINDNIAPVEDVATLSDISETCEVTSLNAPTATDNCIGAITGTHNATLPISTSTLITWSYDDGNGNITTQDQQVNITDAFAPVADVVSLSDIIAECEVTSLTAPTATDNCSGSTTGTSNAVYPITVNTTVTWTYTDGNGNTSTQNQDIIITAVDATTSELNNVITAMNSLADSYQWVDCNDNNNPISGETSQQFTPTINGSYAVEVTTGNCTETSVCTIISTIGISEQDGLSFKVYPNPTSDLITIETEVQIESVSIVNMNGAVVQLETTPQFSIGSLTTGVYFLEIQTSERIWRERIVKQ